MKRWMYAMGEWFDARLRVRATLLPMMRHPIPPEVAGPMGWWYVFGSASMTLLILQILTGIGLALVYVPAAEKAYDSLLYLNYEQPLGWFLRSLHYYAGSGMVVLVLVHMTQVFLHGAYKYPRELTWVIGVTLLILTMAMSFTGYLLPFDQRAYWASVVGVNINGTGPFIGPYLSDFLRAGPEFGATTLSRFYAIHMLLIPGAIIALIGAHLYLITKLGITAPPWLKAEEEPEIALEKSEV
jgi:menaquinol-cytochrome c reductase cytochrome b subunit